ncbi:ribokinase [Bacillus sp. FJAT-18017]|uniref:ribokinase n=1 Tax=Bacillus sp. FJAT-18017 TaxID=1705566 RepID=UPI0006AF111A|nr:ribokinase [Bacillus sp. FJAT-18017]ALC89441.1 ribokinase [Bacillus sp. FJAT-18017]
MKNSAITVIGSINVDLVTVTKRLPDQGETIAGETFHTKSGGKGANQAVAAARLGANVQMIGCVGDDQNGSAMLENLVNEKVSTRMITKIPNTNTGVANIILSNHDNRIIIVPGANQKVTPEYVKQFEQEILTSALVLIQFEIPLETVLYCLDLCASHQIPIIVNPAPAETIPYEYWNKATYITPNEGEATQLFDFYTMSADLNDKLIITKGEHGVSYHKNNERLLIPAYTVTPVDTTGAGDTFNGALCVALTEQQSLESAVKFANAASALSIQKFGAQDGMPTRAEVEAFLG